MSETVSHVCVWERGSSAERCPRLQGTNTIPRAILRKKWLLLTDEIFRKALCSQLWAHVICTLCLMSQQQKGCMLEGSAPHPLERRHGVCELHNLPSLLYHLVFFIAGFVFFLCFIFVFFYPFSFCCSTNLVGLNGLSVCVGLNMRYIFVGLNWLCTISLQAYSVSGHCVIRVTRIPGQAVCVVIQTPLGYRPYLWPPVHQPWAAFTQDSLTLSTTVLN